MRVESSSKRTVESGSQRPRARYICISESIATESDIDAAKEYSDEHYEDIVSYVLYKNGVVKLGKTNSPANLRLTNEGIGMYMNDELTSFWNQDKQRTPVRLEIPLGGSMNMGDFMFQPRTSGNMSLLWVGEE